ncbi:MAG: phage portal protein, partial [Chloroflexia bacterium]
ILHPYGVPKHKIGQFENANRSQSEQADNFFAAETMNPLLRDVAETFNQLAVRYDGCRVEFDDLDVQDRTSDSLLVGRLQRSGIAKRDELRTIYGLPPLGGEIGDAYST